jgi:hypothetical protein
LSPEQPNILQIVTGLMAIEDNPDTVTGINSASFEKG